MSQEIPLENIEETVTIGRGGQPSAPDDLTGKIFSQRYEILELLGRGGMSVVYRARHLVMDKIVALKVLHLHLSKDDLSLRRFKQEAQAASTLTHPGIVAVHDCGESEDGTPYLVMDYVEGISLSDLLEEEGTLSLERFLTIMQQVAAALTHAHQCGVVHRDLKPSNIMISKTEGKTQAKLVDFGIAKMLTQSSNGAQQLTQTGEVFGSPLYMSPEQCTGTAVDHRADIYSLGCVMYEALSGKTPFKGETVFETINKHVNEAPPPLLTPKLDESSRQKLELILLRALAKRPDDRYQSMAELESELRTLELKTKAGLLTALGGAWGLASAKRRASRKNKLPLIVITLTTVSCLSVASVLCLLSGLKKAESDISRLEHSRLILTEISSVQEDFVTLSEAGRVYFTTIFLSPGKADAALELFESARLSATERLDKFEKAVEPDKEFSRAFKKYWKKKLLKIPQKAEETLHEMSQQTDMTELMSPSNLSTSLNLAKMSSDAAIVLRKMTHEAKKAEKEQLGQFKHTEQWIAYLSFLCAGLNGAVVVTLFVYFAKGTPQRLKKLAENASLLSRKRGLAQADSNRDEVADLDNVLQELASALSEAEEREKLLLERLREQEKTEKDIQKKKRTE